MGDYESRDQPTTIASLEGIKIISVTCGSAHTMVISDSNLLYVWGKNNQGQCGMGNLKDIVQQY